MRCTLSHHSLCVSLIPAEPQLFCYFRSEEYPLQNGPVCFLSFRSVGSTTAPLAFPLHFLEGKSHLIFSKYCWHSGWTVLATRLTEVSGKGPCSPLPLGFTFVSSLHLLSIFSLPVSVVHRCHLLQSTPLVALAHVPPGSGHQPSLISFPVPPQDPVLSLTVFFPSQWKPSGKSLRNSHSFNQGTVFSAHSFWYLTFFIYLSESSFFFPQGSPPPSSKHKSQDVPLPHTPLPSFLDILPQLHIFRGVHVSNFFSCV